MKRLLLMIILFGIAALSGCAKSQMAGIDIIPKPLQMKKGSGVFVVDGETKLIIGKNDLQIRQVARYLSDRFRLVAGFNLQLVAYSPENGENCILFDQISDPKLGNEGYRLVVEKGGIKLSANKPNGLFYGVQTILQLLPPQIYAGKKIADVNWVIPAVTVVDKPRYSWRGMMLDVSRHFFPKDFVKQYIDYLAMHKMNTFHWHLNDDQGWRIEIKAYPKLTKVGAWRVDREAYNWNAREAQKPGEKATYGGFYTQDDIREIVAYAKSRFVTIVPEIEMPGHCLAALSAYPQYSCTGGPFTVPPGGVWPIKDVYCAGNEDTYKFLQDILSEVIDLFPGKYIHIGGDEVNKQEWEKCPKCRARIKAEGLKDEKELQSYFIKRMEKFINAKGKRLIGWDEILEGGLAPNATVMSWRGMKGGIQAVEQNHDVVMTPTSHCYFDYYQGDPDNEPPAIGGFLPLQKVYSFEPTPQALSVTEAKHILGAQANLWTEYIATPEQAQYMTFPRIAAIAEVGWTAKELKDWDDFTNRMRKQFRRYDYAGINYAKSAYAVRVLPQFDDRTHQLTVKLETETCQPEIHFTLDGNEPSATSPVYSKPLALINTSVLKAGTFLAGKLLGPVTETKFFVHKAIGRPVKLTFPYQKKYRAGGQFGLTNGLRGSKSMRDGRWQGFEGVDLIAEIDLGKLQPIQKITAGFLQNISSWIFLPLTVEFSVSADGKHFQTLATLKNDVSPKAAEIVKKDFTAGFPETVVRFIRVHAKNRGVCPPWHAGAGRKAWLFADEIIVE